MHSLQGAEGGAEGHAGAEARGGEAGAEGDERYAEAGAGPALHSLTRSWILRWHH